jgi:hypothetical protein
MSWENLTQVNATDRRHGDYARQFVATGLLAMLTEAQLRKIGSAWSFFDAGNG